MKKIVIIGANDFQNPLILKAKEMGFETHVFAWKENAIGEKTADFFYPISIVNKEEILEECKKIKPNAIATIASDLANVTVQYVAERLGLPCNSAETIEKTTNKVKMREALSKAKIKCPSFAEISNKEELINVQDFAFPLIVKPTDRSGSRGINKVQSFDMLENAIKESIEFSFDSKAIVEEFIEGEEFSCECISYQGEHHCLAITKKYTTGAPHFIEVAHMQPACLSVKMMEKIKNEIFRALDALGIENGASHSEFKIDKQKQVNIIEIGSRMGGDCIGSDLVRLSTGYDYVRMVIETSMGIKPLIERESEPKTAFICFIFDSKDLEKLEELKKDEFVQIEHISNIQILNQRIIDSSTRYGYFIATCSDQERAKEIVDRWEK